MKTMIPFKVLYVELNVLRERNLDLALEEASAEEVVSTDADVSTSDIDSLSDGDILTEFREESNMEEDEENEDGNEEECPKRPTSSEIRPTSSEIRQALDTHCCYSLFAQDGSGIRRRTNQLSLIVENSIRESQRQNTIESFFASPESSSEPAADLADIVVI